MKKCNPDNPAFARPSFGYPADKGNFSSEGLTTREYFAAMAMQGLCAVNDKGSFNDEDLFNEAAKMSVKYADALISALNKPT